MIDVVKVLETFRRADFQAFVNDYTLGDLQYKQFFPSEYNPQLTFETVAADFNAKVAADVVAFDSRAPRKGRQIPGTIKGSIPKIEVARVKKESDINTYRMLQDAAARSRGNTNILARIIEFMYGDSRFVLDGVNARMEWLSKRIASTGKYKLTLANNEGGPQTVVDLDFGIPNANIVNATIDWDTVATAKPIDDIRARVTAARAKGIGLRFMFTDLATFDRFTAVESVQKFTASFAQNALNLQQRPNLDTVNAALRGAGLPTFVIWDSYVNLESKSGALGATTGWEDGNILFSPTLQLGTSQNTTPADAVVNIDDSAKANNDFVLVKAFAEQDPITVITKGVAYATPILNGASNLHILKTQL